VPPRRLSRFTFSEGLQDEDGVLFLTDEEPFEYEDLDDNREHLVKAGESLFSLAGRFFRSFPRPAGLFWVIADFQPEPILDATLSLKQGTVLIIPSELAVTTRVFSETRRARR
jgi:hypothetical protein